MSKTPTRKGIIALALFIAVTLLIAFCAVPGQTPDQTDTTPTTTVTDTNPNPEPTDNPTTPTNNPNPEPTTNQPNPPTTPAQPPAEPKDTTYTIALGEGENPWTVTKRVLTEQLGRTPTNDEVMQIDKMVTDASDVAVPEWGIAGSADHEHLPVGYELTFTPDIQAAISALGP